MIDRTPSIQAAQLGDYDIRHVNHVLEMPSWAIEHMLRLLREWPEHFPITQPTWVSQQLGVPTILMRFDCVLDAERQRVNVFELEERPEGMGLSTLVHDRLPTQHGFIERIRELLREWQTKLGPIIFLESPHRKRLSDDAYFAHYFGLEYARGTPQPNGVLYYVRADRHDEPFYQYAPRSLSTIKDEGAKAYGIGLGLWDRCPDDLHDLPWDTGFALKQPQCSRFDGTYLYHKDHRRHGVAATESRARNELIRDGYYRRFTFCQEWIEPEIPTFMPAELKWKLMRRFFFGFSPVKQAWIPLGGCWLARNKNVRMHGASDALFGPLTGPV